MIDRNRQLGETREKNPCMRVAGFAQIQRMCEWGQREIGSHYAF